MSFASLFTGQDCEIMDMELLSPWCMNFQMAFGTSISKIKFRGSKVDVLTMTDFTVIENGV